MPSIAQITSQKATATIDVGGLSIEVTYRPAHLTMHRLQEMERIAKESNLDAMAQLVPSLLAGWDLEGPLEDDAGEVIVDEGETIPIHPDVLVHLPALFYAHLSGELQRLAVEGVDPTTATPRSRKRSRGRG